MLTALTAAAVSGLMGLLIARYQQHLKEDSNAETIVYVKNAKDFNNSTILNELQGGQSDEISISNSRLYFTIKIPIPYPSEVMAFLNLITRLPLILLVISGTIVLIDQENNLSNYWALPYYFALISTILYLLYALFIELRFNNFALGIYYGVIVLLSILSIYYLFNPSTTLLIDTPKNQWVKIIELSSIVMQYSILEISPKPPQAISENK